MSVGEISEREERPAYVRFERRAVEDKAASLEKGRSVSKDVDFALVTPPYSKDVMVNKVETWLSNVRMNVRAGRTPQAWLEYWEKQYEAFKNGQEIPLDGTPIKEWSAISPAQIKNLIAIGILTVEDLAGVNDQGLRRIGMGGQDLKRKAKNWLEAAQDHGPLTMRMTKLEAENARLQVTVDDLISKNKVLMGRLEASSQPIHAETQETSIDVSDIIETTYDEPIKMPEISLQEQFKRKFGHMPHHRMKDETILAKLAE